MNNLFVVGERFGEGYPGGMYVARLLEGKNVNYYIIVGVLEIPSVRAVANSEAWSNSRVRGYESMVVYPKTERTRQPLPYAGEWGEDSKEEYVKSLKAAAEKSMRRYMKMGDEEAAERCRRYIC